MNLFNFFKKKPAPAPEDENGNVTITVLGESVEQEFEVGKTALLFRMVDGSTLTSYVYGTVDQYISTGYSPWRGGEWKDAQVSSPNIYDSKKAAQTAIAHGQVFANNMTNDSDNPSKLINWQNAISVEIGETVSYKKTFPVQTVVTKTISSKELKELKRQS